MQRPDLDGHMDVARVPCMLTICANVLLYILLRLSSLFMSVLLAQCLQLFAQACARPQAQQ